MPWSARPIIPPGGYPRGSDLEELLDRVQFLSDPPRAQLRQTVAQSLTSGAFAAITFGAEDFDNYSGHSTSTNTSRYTAQIAGIYQLAGKAAWAGNATGRRATKWQKNGVDITASQVAIIATSASDVEHPATTMMVSLAVGDYVELHAFQDSGGALNTFVGTEQQPVMTVRWIGED